MPIVAAPEVWKRYAASRVAVTEANRIMPDNRSPREGEEPRSEPEIFRPGERITPSRSDPYQGSEFVQRVYVGRLGPFGFAMLALAFAIAVVVLLALLVGALLFWIPIAVIVVAATIFAGALRSRWSGRR
jgi:hypothetical protein